MIKPGDKPNSVDTTGLCLLSLDGGGVRGLSTLYILKYIMARLNHAREENNLPQVKPCEVFDLIGGTSTGGIIAIMLGRLEMDVDDCIKAYSDLTKEVFEEKDRRIPISWRFRFRAKYDSEKLKRVVCTVFKNSGAHEDDLFNDGTERGCKTFVCVADRHTKDNVRLRSYGLPHEPHIRATIWEAALVTSTATTFFDPIKIGNRSFADGALGSNNPVDETGELRSQVKCFISVGTGKPGTKPFKEGIIKLLGQTLVQIATETENKEKRFIARWAKHFDEKKYFRFNVEQGLQEIGLEQYDKAGEIEAATESYLTHMQNAVRQNRTPKIAIMGLGGVGKTQLVLELLFRTKDKHPDCSIIWIPATNKESLHQAYLGAAQKLGIPGWDNDKEDVKRLVQGYQGRENIGRWLLVFDNADDIDMWIAKAKPGQQYDYESQPLIDYLPRSNQGTILFTTCDRKAAVDLGDDVVEVSDMDEDMAIRLLINHLHDKKLARDQQDAAALLKELTYLPLAISENKDIIELLSEEFKDNWRYQDVKNPVATTWLISFEQIRQRDPFAAEYLSFMACMEPKDIPQSLLPPGPTRKKEVDAIGTLNAYSFITRRPADMAFDIHRLVHLATQNWLRKEEQLSQSIEKAIVRLEEVFPNGGHENRSLWRTYLTHVRYAIESDLIKKDSETRLNLMWRYATCLYQDGR
ncbi:FabD/lysophospholipase-like protein [Delitschia confertaspora ATCC 74209]|uniref:FabD/lysophospholipase-like protein n=1 Tax=Delitschia confertaspora ATCC 74209 TaxID=1513339 RepID=A0A9P4JRM8_9PLEO|nr:FabD/lysophospholipase-like protein [Delitschia confertaspora ATCC 74209]